MRHSCVYFVAALVCLSVCFCAVSVASAAAQKSAAKSAGKAEAAKAAKEAGETAKILREGAVKENEKALAGYFGKFWKNFKGSGQDDLPKLRKDLRNFFKAAHAGKSAEAYQWLNDLTYTATREIIKPTSKFSTPVKYNALLMIGELNDSEGEGGKAKPYSKALPLLIGFVQSDKTDDYMKVAALIGLERFASSGGVPADKVESLTDTLLKIVTQKDPPAGRDPAAHQYLRRSAAQVLAGLGSPGKDNRVLKAFQDIVADPNSRLTLRCETALYIGQLKYPPAAKVDLQQLANLLGTQAIEQCKSEMESAKNANRSPSRRLLMYSLYSAKEGLTGPYTSSASNSDAQRAIGNIRKKLDDCLRLLDSADAEENSVPPEFEDKMAELQGVLKAVPTAKK